VSEEKLAIIKTTFRLPKPLMKRVRQYGLDAEKTINEIAVEALEDYLKKRNH
jgi:hypothetical protein